MVHTLPELPWARDALAPHMSAETIDYHYGKHHATYVKKLNEALPGTRYESMSLLDIVRVSASEGPPKIFNNAAQHFNHSFFWNCLSPDGGGDPTGAADDTIRKTFGDVATFRQKFTDEAVNHFASGWAWLVRRPDGTVAVMSTHDADTPVAHGTKPLLVCDVWEHAYYIDRRNDRAAFLAAFWKIVNWDFVSRNLAT